MYDIINSALVSMRPQKAKKQQKHLNSSLLSITVHVNIGCYIFLLYLRLRILTDPELKYYILKCNSCHIVCAKGISDDSYS